MELKLKKRFVFPVIIFILFSKGCNACFKYDSVSNRSVITFSGFYEECCCTEPGYTVNDLLWLNPLKRVIGPDNMGSKVYIEKQDECLSLHIPSSSQTLSGAYSCVTEYDGTPHYQTHVLDVFDPLYFFKTPSNQYLVQRQDSLIHCKAKGASQPFIRWYRGKDGRNEIYNGTVKYLFLDEGLLIRDVVSEDAGTYKCSASVLSTGEEKEADIEVEVWTIPKITNLTPWPGDTIIAETSLVIECTAEGLPAPEYTWQKITDSVDNEKKNATWQQDNNTIRFETIQAEDAGIYQCTAANFAGNTTSNIKIKVLVAPEIIGFNNRTAINGTEMPIFCNATGNPVPNVTITYEGKSLDEEKDTMYEQFITNYAIIKVTTADQGIYICNASNEVDFVTKLMYLTVQHRPYFTQDRETLWGWNGEKVELNCEHQANPPSNITWRYIKNMEANADENNINDYLNTPDELNSLKKKWYYIKKEFEPYGLYECHVKNDLGEAIKVIDLRRGFPPLAVQKVSITEVTIKTATFTIDYPTDNDEPLILGFKAEYDLKENYNITNIHPNRTWAKDRPFKLEKLKPNSTYYIRFAAINKGGIGAWGEMLEFYTLEKSAPEPPIWEVDSLRCFPSIVLKWKEPEDNGEPIDYYALRYCPMLDEFDESLCKEKRVEAATEQELDDLLYNTTYYFELIAHNSLGNSTSANISLIVPAEEELAAAAPLLSQAAIIGISVVLVIVGLILLDLICLFWRHQGIFAMCCFSKSKKKPDTLHPRDKKGLLKDNRENIDDTLRKPNNGHREYEYNKTTGIITGKHSSV